MMKKSKNIKKLLSVQDKLKTEQPPSEKNKNRIVKMENRKLEASDLFSHFTADIIKEDVVFTR